VEVVDVARELHSPVFLESQVCWQPLILTRPVFGRNAGTTYRIVMPESRPAIFLIWINNVVFPVLRRCFAFAGPYLNGIGYPNNFFLEKI
jgi:hypothetical protein